MNWLAYSLFALFTFTIYELLSRHLSVESKNPLAFGAVFYFAGALVTPILFFIQPIPAIHISPVTLLSTLFGLVAWILFGRIEYSSHKYVEASVLTILIRLGPVITFVLSVLFLREALTAVKMIALLLTIIASVLVVQLPTLKELKKSRHIIYGVVLGVVLGVAWTFDKVLTPVYGVIVYSLMTFLAPAISNVLFPRMPMKALIAELRRASWKLWILALSDIIGYGAMLKALTIGDASSVIPVATATPPLVVLGGALLLGERSNMTKKIIAVLLVIVAIYLMR